MRHEFDDEPVVVIGSGPCGAVAAHQLVTRGVDVLMLDSGLVAPRGFIVRAAGNTIVRRTDHSQYESGRLAPNSSPNAAWFSSRSHGGLSNYWTAAVPRFAPADFTDGARLDERFRWPVDYEALEPYYQLAEHHLVVTTGDAIRGVPANAASYRHRLSSDWQEIVRSAAERGIGMGAIPMAKGKPWMAARRSTEFNSHHCVIRPLLESDHFQLRRGAHAARLIWSPTEQRVTAVEYVDRTTRTVRTVRARGVVVAAGAIDSTMLLLRSTSTDFPDGIGNSSDLVGRYLHDHPREWWPATTGRSMRALAHPLYVARPRHEDSEPLLATSHTMGLISRAQRLRTYYRGRTTTIGVQVFGTMVPTPESGITIDRDARIDAIDQRATMNLNYTDAEVRNLESSRDRLRQVLADAGLPIDISGPFHGLSPGSSVHLGGTVRMHDDPKFGVLDAWNRMHDAPDVVVCDLSSFTTGPEKNPTLTAMALAIRAADRLASDRC